MIQLLTFGEQLRNLYRSFALQGNAWKGIQISLVSLSPLTTTFVKLIFGSGSDLVSVRISGQLATPPWGVHLYDQPRTSS